MMKKYLYLFLLLFPGTFCRAEVIYGTVADSATRAPIHGVTVRLNPGDATGISDENGRFVFRKASPAIDMIAFSMVGYGSITIRTGAFKNGDVIYLCPKISALKDVVISSGSTNPFKTISESDIRLRGISNSQEALRIVPGLFIGQHQGGGKAEQIFLRGFDNDHGTDINMSLDGMPINLVSHAHGQGYADSHFIIPELIGNTTYQKGMYAPDKGDLAVTGYVNFSTLNAVRNTLRVEAGQFNTYRALGMWNLLGAEAAKKGSQWYAASEYRFSDSYFEHSQDFKRFNFFTKYTGRIGEKNYFSLSASNLYSTWKATSQLPLDAVLSGQVSYFGAIDPNEGGKTTRTNFNAQLKTTLSERSMLKNQLYYSYYTFDLHADYSYFLTDTVNGDEVRQQEKRNLAGYNGTFIHESFLGYAQLTTEAGINIRFDATSGTSLQHTRDNYIVLDSLKYGDITELGTGAYVSETLKFNDHFTLYGGLRFDNFYYGYRNRLGSDSSFKGKGYYDTGNRIVSPKLKFIYHLNRNVQFYLLAGKGFHTNDARVVLAEKGGSTLPATYGSDIGTVLKPARNLLFNIAGWISHLQKEYVYGSDGGTADFSGRTKRLGFDFSGRYQPVPFIYLDADVNYAHGRALDALPGENYIPLAPVWTSTGGLTYQSRNGINGSIRYRWMGTRAANEDYSLKASGYFVNDLVLNYTRPRYEFGVTVNNLFNVRWKETQYAQDTKLPGQPADHGLTFTPGTKFFAVAHATVFF